MTLGVEGSRGCWWAERGTCLFCGQNGSSRRYRKKSATRLLRELRDAAEMAGCTGVDLVDNVVSDEFLSEVVAELVERPLGVPVFFEARPELTRAQVSADRRDGRGIQVGIESLNDHVLTLMHKGSTALRNVRLLKWCKADGLSSAWNLLFGFPGETHDDYKALVELVPSLTHLRPPKGCGRCASTGSVRTSRRRTVRLSGRAAAAAVLAGVWGGTRSSWRASPSSSRTRQPTIS